MEFISLAQILKFFFALLFVLSLMLGLTFVLKGLENKRFKLRALEKKRLGISEILILDNKRKVVLIHRDEKEHLIMLGPNEETVIESGIKKDINLSTQPSHVTNDDISNAA
jgi:flagellar protein FliO/FliZ